MRAFVHTAQMGAADVRIALCGRDRLVPKQLLDSAKVGSAFEKMGGKAMTENV